MSKADLIDRQEAIDAIQRYKYEHGFDFHACAMGIERDIKALPSAQPEPQWISCKDRLPENGRQVLVYARSVHYALAKYDEMREADGTYKKQWVTFDAWKPFYTIKEVIAWMPLPECHKGEVNDKKRSDRKAKQDQTPVCRAGKPYKRREPSRCRSPARLARTAEQKIINQNLYYYTSGCPKG